MGSLGKLALLARSLVGLWLGLWTITGVAILASGLFTLALQLYGYFYLGFWAHLTPGGILRGFSIAPPSMPWTTAQKAVECVLLMPLAGVFIWCGFHIAAMAWIARMNLERKHAPPSEVIPIAQNRGYGELGITGLQVRKSK